MLSRLVLQSPGGVAADAQSTRPPEPWRSRRRCSVNSNILEQMTKVADHIWLFQCYRQAIEYEGTHPAAIHSGLPVHDQLFLETDQVEKLHDFEEESMEALAREQKYKKNTSSEELIHRTAERTERKCCSFA
ncbi:hypothetical protein QR680_007732 [Steinernema hermaphroditum]|uniref:Uncharacterized protein n=1 Tax=Steinernema hermaphroditum TaxID=289476 RepID=A0AA39M6F4_9BILA|nr:hypothetical protein QR680_007732 [Steinernema hermaphroditum]